MSKYDQLFSEKVPTPLENSTLKNAHLLMQQQQKEKKVFLFAKILGSFGLVAILFFTSFQLYQLQNNNQLQYEEIVDIQLDDETPLDESIEIASELEILEDFEILQASDDFELKEAI